MTEDTVQKILKIEIGFAPEAAAEIARLKEQSRTDSTVELLVNALRVYGWFLEHKNTLHVKQDKTWTKVDLQL